jgi:hypothetical protein
MAGTVLSPDHVSTATKRARAIHLCAGGYDFATIAQEVGYRNVKEVKHAISSGLNDMQFEAVDELRSVELNRLDRITARLWTVIEPYLATMDDPANHPVDRKTLEAIALYLKVSERRAKYTGMESTHLEINTTGESTQTVQIQIVQDVERFQQFITERVLEQQDNPRIIAAEIIDGGNNSIHSDERDNDFSLTELRSRDGSDGRPPSQSTNGHGSRLEQGNWSDSRGDTSGSGEIVDPAVLSPDSKRETG